ncbi:hypothetical protein [Vibrio parahaemolyticus]|uniref:hypothetical protein n=1 Tax=Vibrio parahaemolyticus TaxID=670 RepID=UPI001D98B0CB|nr:hypothetical protein [Vibrio parahaemolyticus]
MNLDNSNIQWKQKSQAAFHQGGLAFFAFQTAVRQHCNLINKSLIASTIKRANQSNVLTIEVTTSIVTDQLQNKVKEFHKDKDKEVYID